MLMPMQAWPAALRCPSRRCPALVLLALGLLALHGLEAPAHIVTATASSSAARGRCLPHSSVSPSAPARMPCGQPQAAVFT